MKLSNVFPCLMNKAIRKGRTEAEVYEVTCWLTGYDLEQLKLLISSDITYKEFFDGSPCFNPKSQLITGSICGIKLNEIENETMRRIRYLDKLVDELAKGKTIEKILRQ